MDENQIVAMLSTLIQQTWDLVDVYNGVITSTEDEVLLDVLNEIVTNEYTNIGQLEKLLGEVNPAASSINESLPSKWLENGEDATLVNETDDGLTLEEYLDEEEYEEIEPYIGSDGTITTEGDGIPDEEYWKITFSDGASFILPWGFFA